MRAPLLLPLVLAVACADKPAASPSPPPSPRTLLVVSIDGLRHDYLDDTTHAIPNLRRLAHDGARARTVRGVWPTMTYPSHASLVTGVTPARHGIWNNVVFDPYGKNQGGWYWYASDLKVKTLWDVAADAGIDVANATWPVTVGARIRWNLPQLWRAKNVEDEKLLAAVSTPGLWAEVAKNAPPPGEHRDDRARADAGLYLLKAKHPGLALVYLTDLDNVEHDTGPLSPEAWKTLERIDGMVGELVAAAGPHATVAIVSDHGFVPVDTEVRVNVALRDAGLLTTRVEDGRTELGSFRAYAWRAGGTAAVYAEPTAAAQTKELFAKLASDPANRIARVLDGKEVERQGGFPGALLVLQAAPGATFASGFDPPLVAPTAQRGVHGNDPSLPEMGAILVLWGEGVRPGDLGDVSMLDVAPTLAALLGVSLPQAEGHPLRSALLSISER